MLKGQAHDFWSAAPKVEMNITMKVYISSHKIMTDLMSSHNHLFLPLV